MSLSFDGVTKSFSGVPVLKEVTLAVPDGHVLGLAGANGAGKSTLMNILGGGCLPDAGTLAVGGRSYAPRTPADARAAGIAFVHQEVAVFPNLTLAENLLLGRFPRRSWRPWIDRASCTSKARQLLARVGLHHAPSTLAAALTLGERQLLEIARALGEQSTILILDEPTTSLGAGDRDRLHGLVVELRRSGMTIVYISHELSDVVRVSDSLAVLRDGRLAAHDVSTAFSPNDVVRLMVGREVAALYPERRPARTSQPVLDVKDLHVSGNDVAVSLTIGRGEILGIFGLLGAGRSRLVRALMGLEPSRGNVFVDGERLDGSPGERVRRGVALVTEDRHEDGLCLGATVADNLRLPGLRSIAPRWHGVIHRRAVRRHLDDLKRSVAFPETVDEHFEVGRLSGGNQQKVALGKWLRPQPRVLMLDEPTRGIDISARAQIYQVIRQLADQGVAVLVISSDADELMGLADRILVMRRGRIAGSFAHPKITRLDLLQAALPPTEA